MKTSFLVCVGIFGSTFNLVSSAADIKGSFVRVQGVAVRVFRENKNETFVLGNKVDSISGSTFVSADAGDTADASDVVTYKIKLDGVREIEVFLKEKSVLVVSQYPRGRVLFTEFHSKLSDLAETFKGR